MIQKTAALVSEGKLVGISEIRDESDRNGMRIVYEIKRDAIPNVVLNKLFKYTSLQTSFSVNNIALVNGRPVVLNLKDLIVHFIAIDTKWLSEDRSLSLKKQKIELIYWKV